MSNICTETIRWVCRLLLDRKPEDLNVVKKSFPEIPTLLEGFLGSLEYRIKNTGIQLAPDTWVIKQTIYGKGLWTSPYRGCTTWTAAPCPRISQFSVEW